MSHYLDMGKYGVYLWPAYGVTLLAVVLNVVWARRLLVRSQADALRRLASRGDTE
jgi:heme exporter protein CcmD